MEKINDQVTEWKVGGRTFQPSRKVPYTSKQRIKDDMSESEKRGAERWNQMVDVLKENGLMEDK